MGALPASLAPAEPLARTIYQSGWRTPLADGPTRDELVQLATEAYGRARAARRARTAPPVEALPEREAS